MGEASVTPVPAPMVDMTASMIYSCFWFDQIGDIGNQSNGILNRQYAHLKGT
jgi:hypothetical protein